MKIQHKKTEKISFKMEKIILRFILPLFTIGILCQSCVDELEQINPNALTNESFWTNAGDLNAGLNAVYASLRDESILGILFEDYRTDIGVPQSFRQNQNGDPLYDQTFDLTTDEVQDKWDACYRGIFRANQVIDAYQNLESKLFSGSADSEATGLRLLAQARALRGYFYYVLHSSYNQGKIPLFETVPKSFDEFQKPFSSSDEIKNFYRADLMFGMENLPATYNAWHEEAGSGNLGRITGGACEALMAKSYMNENDFTNAEIHLKSIMDNYGYELVDNLAEILTGISEFNSESIFEINYTTDVQLVSTDERILSQRISSFLNDGIRIQPSTWLILAYRNDKPDPADPANYVDRNLYDESNGDLIGVDENVLRKYSIRMGNSISSVDDPDSPMYGETAAVYGLHPNANTHARQYPNFWKKFTGWNIPNGGQGEDESPEYDRRSGINIPVIRLGEIYLLYAECMIEKGDLDEALKYINRLRKRSHLYLLGKTGEFTSETTYIDDVNLNPDELNPVNLTNLRERLMYLEKPMELALEHERTVDLRRWGVWKERLQYISQFEYNAWHFRENLNGPNPRRFRCFALPPGELPPYRLINQNNPDSQQNGRKDEPQLKDHVLGAQNFVESLHSYFPIPQDEINANLNWDQ